MLDRLGLELGDDLVGVVPLTADDDCAGGACGRGAVPRQWVAPAAAGGHQRGKGRGPLRSGGSAGAGDAGMTGTRPGGDLWRRGSRARRWGRGDVGAEVERVVGDHWVSFRRRAPAGGTIHRKTVEVFWTAGGFSDSACLCFRLPSSGPGNRFRPRSGCDTLGLSEDGHDCISARSTRQYR